MYTRRLFSTFFVSAKNVAFNNNYILFAQQMYKINSKRVRHAEFLFIFRLFRFFFTLSKQLFLFVHNFWADFLLLLSLIIHLKHEMDLDVYTVDVVSAFSANRYTKFIYAYDFVSSKLVAAFVVLFVLLAMNAKKAAHPERARRN